MKTTKKLKTIMKTTKKLKTIALSLGLAAAMLPVANVSAQGVFGDMLDNYYSEKESGSGNGPLLRSGGESGTVSGEGLTVYTQDFGQAPLGSGIAILIGAGLGYVALKKKEEQQ